MKYLLVFIGGGFGATARYLLGGVVHRLAGTAFPYGTLAVNIIGSFVLGLLMAMFEERFAFSPPLRVFLTIGVLGGFTTFSSFSYETMALFRDGSYLSGLINIGVSVLGCLAATWMGMAIGKSI